MAEYMIVPTDSIDDTADAIRSKISIFENLDYTDLALYGTTSDSVTSANIEFTNPLVVGEEYTITASFDRTGKLRNNSIVGTFTFSSYPIAIPSGITVSSGSWDSRDALSIYETYINGPHYTDEDWTFEISVKIEKKDQTLIWGQDGFASYVESIPSVGSYELLGQINIPVSTTSTTTTVLHTFNFPAAWTYQKILYIRVRRTEVPDSGYFYGSDNFFIIAGAFNGSTAEQTTAIRTLFKVGTDGTWSANTTSYGVYGSGVSPNGNVKISTRYNSSNSGTINGTFKVEVYLLSWPNNITPFLPLS